MAEQIVSIGFLTQNDLDVLGRGFRRHFPVENEHPFADLISRLDHVSQYEDDRRSNRDEADG